jgi:hypothetical protein
MKMSRGLLHQDCGYIFLPMFRTIKEKFYCIHPLVHLSVSMSALCFDGWFCLHE